MWKLLKILGHLVKALLWAALLLVCVALALLYILEHGLPRSAVDKIEQKLSSDEVIVNIGRVHFNLKTGLHLHNVKAYPRRIASESFGSVEDIVLKFSLSPGMAHTQRLESVTLKNVNSPHHPRKILRQLAAMSPKDKDKEEPRKPIPTLAPFDLIIKDSHIVGFKARKATASVALHDPMVSFDNIVLEWPEASRQMLLTGRIGIDLDSEILDGAVSGEAFPENVTGFLQELGTRVVLLELSRFSEIIEPIKVGCGFNVDLQSNDFSLTVDLDIAACAYRGVPLKYAKGNIKAWETNDIVQVDLQGLRTENADGKLEGSLFYDETDESLKVNALSTMRHKDVTTIIDILTHDELGPLICDQPPVVTANGIVAVATNAPITHNLSGRIKIGTASIFKLNVQQADCAYAMVANEATLSDIKAATPSGGSVTGSAVFSIPPEHDLPASIATQASFNKIDLSDLAGLFSITNSKVGECSGNLTLASVLGTNQLHTLNGAGEFKVDKGKLNQLRLFAGLTDYMSRNIPGVASLINQSECSLKFKIKDGLLSTDSFDIEGDVFNINGKGTYDIPKDRLDLTVHVALFRRGSLAGKLSRLVTFPFKKLLLEFKVYGTSEDPQWSYVNILEKIMDQIPGMDNEKETDSE
ncbi:MAG: AsmA-like C-terminal region-containing protein [Kiritimatiellae bacterium]|nr:AsmA-like C-terminal region-containing protein [Kiritimatiellia bacterium]